ncbi:conserved hypothetical protein [Leishmania mexicana MHOM/GT/2001/U1103]|uniref:Uncharacterized protein n=1 Tax=Leishmania mexicana (strain MHOM/GT/2001/U1103) TaxID=929439 RepID=E9ARC3_LEIMU|nr:conserved hypothetical protein [Leishmania mexicana MHOM/GT/2001/U1103]CBZ25352.1 conserved hypothetical protein [Leishmania mexicana MHOM/GT/2001/U1103]
MRVNESPAILFITTVLSHIALLPTLHFFYRRKYIFELCCASFGFLASFMYHTTESFGTSIFLSEVAWHRLDNVGVISILGIWCVYLCCFQNPCVDMSCKCFCIFFTLVVQQKHPWDVRLTISPILFFTLFPVVKHCFIEQRIPPFCARQLACGVFLFFFATIFFFLGLDSRADRYRMYHGAWHFFGGLSSFFLWEMVKTPGCTGNYAVQRREYTLRGDTMV